METEEIRKFLEEDYPQAFSSKEPRQVMGEFASDSELSSHQLGLDKSGKGGKGKTVRVHTGSLWKSLAKGRMPASIMLAIVFRRLAKFNYHRSTIELSEVVNSRGGFPVALVRWERHCDQGNVFERGDSVLKLDSSEGRWKIAEGWTLDEPSQWDPETTGVQFSRV